MTFSELLEILFVRSCPLMHGKKVMKFAALFLVVVSVAFSILVLKLKVPKDDMKDITKARLSKQAFYRVYSNTSAVTSSESRKYQNEDSNQVDENHLHFKRFYRTKIAPSLREIAKHFHAEGSVKFSLPLFDGQEALVVVQEYTPYGDEGGAFTGIVEGDSGSFVSISFFEDAECGSIHIPAQNLVYSYQPQPDGSVLVGDVDVSTLGECGTCINAGAVKKVLKNE